MLKPYKMVARRSTSVYSMIVKADSFIRRKCQQCQTGKTNDDPNIFLLSIFDLKKRNR